MSRALSLSRARQLHSFVSRSSAGCSPPVQRCRTLRRRQTEQQTLDRNVYIEVWPMNPDAWTNQSPTPSLARPPLGQARVPVDRHRHAPTVAEFDDERVLGDLNVF